MALVNALPFLPQHATMPPPDCIFNFANADLILLSSDDSKFYVHRCILAAASPFFEHMFSLPQPPATDSQREEQHHLVPLSEARPTIDTLLRFVYPLPDPSIEDLDQLVSVLGAAVKYDFMSVIVALRKLLLSPHFLQQFPTRVYAIATRYDLEHEAQVASRYTLLVNILDCPLSDDLKFITAYSYHRLLNLHRSRAKAAQDLLQVPQDVKCMQCNGSIHGAFVPPKWWKEFQRMATQELAFMPTTDVIFSLKFLARVAEESGCSKCAVSILDSHQFLQDLKRRIDDLPSTI